MTERLNVTGTGQTRAEALNHADVQAAEYYGCEPGQLRGQIGTAYARELGFDGRPELFEVNVDYPYPQCDAERPSASGKFAWCCQHKLGHIGDHIDGKGITWRPTARTPAEVAYDSTPWPACDDAGRCATCGAPVTGWDRDMIDADDLLTGLKTAEPGPRHNVPCGHLTDDSSDTPD